MEVSGQVYPRWKSRRCPLDGSVSGSHPERCMEKVQALPITGIETWLARSLYTGAARKAKRTVVGNDGTETRLDSCLQKMAQRNVKSR